MASSGIRNTGLVNISDVQYEHTCNGNSSEVIPAVSVHGCLRFHCYLSCICDAVSLAPVRSVCMTLTLSMLTDYSTLRLNSGWHLRSTCRHPLWRDGSTWQGPIEEASQHVQGGAGSIDEKEIVVFYQHIQGDRCCSLDNTIGTNACSTCENRN